MTERDFQRQVLDLARLYRWEVYHTFLSKWSEPGWPDLAMVRPPRLLFAELKGEKGTLSPSQVKWLNLLREVPFLEVHVWRPADLPAIAQVLR